MCHYGKPDEEHGDKNGGNKENGKPDGEIIINSNVLKQHFSNIDLVKLVLLNSILINSFLLNCKKNN